MRHLYLVFFFVFTAQARIVAFKGEYGVFPSQFESKLAGAIKNSPALKSVGWTLETDQVVIKKSLDDLSIRIFGSVKMWEWEAISKARRDWRLASLRAVTGFILSVPKNIVAIPIDPNGGRGSVSFFVSTQTGKVLLLNCYVSSFNFTSFSVSSCAPAKPFDNFEEAQTRNLVSLDERFVGNADFGGQVATFAFAKNPSVGLGKYDVVQVRASPKKLNPTQ